MAKDIFSKIIKDYNNELELILEKKDFESNVKNLLLSMLYKIENGYDDYKKVKVNVCSKKQFVKEILETIEKRCNKIELIRPTSEEGEKLHNKGLNCVINKEEGTIKTFQNEKSILDAILQMRQEDIEIDKKHELIIEPLKEMLLIGNNMNSLELITDFNGWSWDLAINNRKNIVYNILYQYINILTGNKIIESWVNNRKDDDNEEEMPSNLIISSKFNETFGITKKEIIGEKEDYILKIRDAFKEKYGKERENEFFKKIMQVAILECTKNNKKYKLKIEERIQYLNNKYNCMKDNKTFIINLTQEKKNLANEIDELDRLISNEKELKKEYEKYNEKLPKEEKIFSVSHYKLMLEKQRKNKFAQIKDINKKMGPREFVKIKTELEDKIRFYNEININSRAKSNMDSLIIELQKEFIKCFDIKIENANDNKELENLIYELRYYKFISSATIKGLVDVTDLEKKIIKKAYEQKLLTKFSEQESTNYLLLKEIFISKIIDLDTIVYVLKYSKGIITIDIFDGSTDDETKKIELKEKTVLNVKLNKKIKLWA